MSTDIEALAKQYAQMQEKQHHACVVISGIKTGKRDEQEASPSQTLVSNNTKGNDNSVAMVTRPVPLEIDKKYRRFSEPVSPKVLGETKCFFIQNKKNRKAHVKVKDEQNADQNTKAVSHTEHMMHFENTVQDKVLRKMNESKSDTVNHDNLTDHVREEDKADSDDKGNSVQSMEHHLENSVLTTCLNTKIAAISSAEGGSTANMNADLGTENQVSASEGTEVQEVKLYTACDANSYSASYTKSDFDSKSDSASNTKLDCNLNLDSASTTKLDCNSNLDSASNTMLDCNSNSDSASTTKSDSESKSDSASNTKLDCNGKAASASNTKLDCNFKPDCDSNMNSDSKSDLQCSAENSGKDQPNSQKKLKCNKTSSNQLHKSFVQNGSTEVNERKLLSHPSIRFSKQYYPSRRSEVQALSSRRRINSAESDSKQSIYQHFTLTKRQLSLDSGFHEEEKNQKPVPNLEFPFPVQLFNEHKIKAGMKLGLYDKKTLENLEKSLKRKSLKKKMPSLRVE